MWKPGHGPQHLSPPGLDGFPARLDQRLPLLDRLIPLNPLHGFDEGWLTFDWLPLVHKDVAAPVRLDRITVKPEAVGPIRPPKPSIQRQNLVHQYCSSGPLVVIALALVAAVKPAQLAGLDLVTVIGLRQP